jgi:hypothetical protein
MRHGIKTLALAALLISPLASGAPVAYTDEAAFLAAVTPTIVESFEDESLTDALPSLSTTNFTVQITPLSGSFAGVIIDDSPGWASDGVQYLGGGAGGPNPWRLDFTLSFPVYAIAFDVMSASEAPTQSGGMSVVRFDLPTGEEFVMSSCPPCLQSPGFPGSADYFFGIVSDVPFTTFSIVNTAYSDGVAFDRMQFVPALDPAAMLQQLAADVAGVGPGKSLASKIALAQTYYSAGDIPATCAVLTDFVSTVQGFATGRKPKLSSETAAALIADAESIMAAIGCN